MSDKPCPKCGHCPACGRSNAPTNPYGVYPYWPPRPWYGQPYAGTPRWNQTSSTSPQSTYTRVASAFQLSNAI